MPSVRITEDNPALTMLHRSWATAIYSDEDGLGPMGSLHEAGDALVALAQLEEYGPTVLGSGVMIRPGLVVAATHVLDEFSARRASPLLLTFLPDGARAWLPRESSTVSEPSVFGEDRRQVSDVTLLSCTLNSEAHVHHPLILAPLQISPPLVGERLWAFGYRHGALQDATALITPLVTSGLVTAAFPQGRGERMPSACIEVAMDTKGGMSGGPVVNANGDLVGIVSSSIEGGPSYVTLIWEALRLTIGSRLPSLTGWDIDLFAAQRLGLLKLKGRIRRRRNGDVTITLPEPKIELLAASVDPAAMVSSCPGGRFLNDAHLEDFQERWLPEMETAATVAALAHLKGLALATVRSFLAASDAAEECLAPIRAVTVEEFEGLEDPEILSAREEEGTITVSFGFELLTVVWTVEVAYADYRANAAAFEEHFMNIETEGETTRMETMQRCYFEADLTLNQLAGEFTSVSIALAGVKRFTKRQ